jgi:hypothetical protein
MFDINAVVLDVWRQAGRSIEIGQSTATIAAMLAQHMPLGQILVRQVDPDRPSLETITSGLIPREGVPGEARTDCSAADMERLLAWCRQGQVARRNGSSSLDVPWNILLPPGIDGDATVCSILSGGM